MTEDEKSSADDKWQTGKVERIVERTERIKSFFITPAKPFTFLAGQHVDLRLTAEDGYSAMRSYSIASAPNSRGEVELAIERLDDGEVSPFFHDVVALGDEIELRGPLGGYFVWEADDESPVLLIGGGSGCVPLVSMVRHVHTTQPQRPVILLISARTQGDVPFRDELRELDGHHLGFRLALALTREQVSRPSIFGRRIDPSMLAEVVARLPNVPRIVFVCGSNPFVNTATDSAIAAGVRTEDIRTERYGA